MAGRCCANCGAPLPGGYRGNFCRDNADCKAERNRKRKRKSRKGAADRACEKYGHTIHGTPCESGRCTRCGTDVRRPRDPGEWDLGIRRTRRDTWRLPSGLPKRKRLPTEKERTRISEEMGPYLPYAPSRSHHPAMRPAAVQRLPKQSPRLEIPQEQWVLAPDINEVSNTPGPADEDIYTLKIGGDDESPVPVEDRPKSWGDPDRAWHFHLGRPPVHLTEWRERKVDAITLDAVVDLADRGLRPDEIDGLLSAFGPEREAA